MYHVALPTGADGLQQPCHCLFQDLTNSCIKMKGTVVNCLITTIKHVGMLPLEAKEASLLHC